MQLNAAVPIDSMEPDLLLRLGIAVLLGVLLGVDREAHGHPAGLRTHGLVCVASAGMMVSILALYHQLGGMRLDALRVFEAAGAFVGIIGAGLIVFARGRVHNLTTAAHLWLTATVGLACGAGQWPLVAILAVSGVLLLTVLGILEGRWSDDKPLGSDGDKP